MKVWYDCEFLDDGRVIDLINIGMVAEDGRELYLQCTDSIKYLSTANEWVKANVIPHLVKCPGFFMVNDLSMHHSIGHNCTFSGCPWYSRKEIAHLVETFLAFPDSNGGKVELWGYYAAYDHVALAQLWGPMIDLPKGIPMFTHDLKQWCDGIGNPQLPLQVEGEHNALEDARWNKSIHMFLSQITMQMMNAERPMPAGLKRVD